MYWAKEVKVQITDASQIQIDEVIAQFLKYPQAKPSLSNLQESSKKTKSYAWCCKGSNTPIKHLVWWAFQERWAAQSLQARRWQTTQLTLVATQSLHLIEYQDIIRGVWLHDQGQITTGHRTHRRMRQRSMTENLKTEEVSTTVHSLATMLRCSLVSSSLHSNVQNRHSLRCQRIVAELWAHSLRMTIST